MQLPSREDHGFSLIELTIVMLIVGLLSAIAIPAVLSQRTTAQEASAQADLRKVETSVRTLLDGWRGSPPVTATVATSSGTWSITGASTASLASGKTSSPDVAVTGFVYTDGTYCLLASPTSGSAGSFMLTSDTETPIRTTSTCSATSNLAGVNSAGTLISGSSLPAAVTGISYTTPVTGSLTLAWSAVSGATSYIVKTAGLATQTVTATTATLTGVTGTSVAVTLYAKNANGVGPGSTVQATLGSAASTTVQRVWTDLTLTSNFSASRLSSGLGTTANYTKASNGIVAVQVSSMTMTAAPAAGSVIASLPSGYCPQYKTAARVSNNAITQQVYVTADSSGCSIITGSNWITGSTSFAFLYPANGVATWTTIGAAGSGSSLGTGVTDAAISGMGPARYWKDGDGIVWLGGTIKFGTAPTADTVAVNLPTGYTPFQTSSFVTVSGASVTAQPGAYCPWIATGTTLSLRANNTGATTWVSLDDIRIITNDAAGKLNFTFPATLAAGYTESIPTGWMVTTYGMVILSGEYTAPATAMTRVFTFPLEIRPYQTLYLATPSGSSVATQRHILMYLNRPGPQMATALTTVTGTYGSLDNIAYLTGQ